jgi:predicted RNase H-like HicB family nuclease
MTHYVAIFTASDDGEWRVVFPDVPACEAGGHSLEEAKFAGVNELSRHLQANGGTLPPPRDLAEIKRDEAWLARNEVTLSNVVITMIAVGR